MLNNSKEKIEGLWTGYGGMDLNLHVSSKRIYFAPPIGGSSLTEEDQGCGMVGRLG